MVKKLYKHEFAYFFRTIAIFLPAVVALALLTRLTMSTQNDSIISRMAATSTTMIFLLSSLALLLFVFALGIIRFYKNMYSGEGYLTFSLPVSHFQHITVKLTVYVSALLLTGIVVVISLLLAFGPIDFSQIFDSFSALVSNIPTVHVVFYLIELVFLLLVALVRLPLLFYACISIGQLAKKNRILLAIGAYYLHGVMKEVLGTVSMVFLTIASELPIADVLTFWYEKAPLSVMHVGMWLGIALEAGFAVLWFWITYYMMHKKLNLE